MTFVAAGKDIDALCTRCKLVLGHVIIAVDKGVPVRIKCNTCHTERKWRPTADNKTGGLKVAVRRAKSDKPTTAGQHRSARAHDSTFEREQKWLAFRDMAERGGKSEQPYDMGRTYAMGDVVVHSKFGVGYICGDVGPSKLTVCFKEGEKVLVHGRR